MESSFLLTLIVALMALALIAGFIGSLSGLGGGMFIVPALVIFAHLPMHAPARSQAKLPGSSPASCRFPPLFERGTTRQRPSLYDMS